MAKTCNDCKECKAIKGKLYCGRSAKEIANGKRNSLLYVKREAPCYYDK